MGIDIITLGFKTLKRLIFIPVCASCKERLSPFAKNEGMMHGNICFCDKCLKGWEEAKAQACPVCFQTACDCLCAPEFFKKRQPNIPSLCFYHPEKHDAQSNAVITMKRVRDTELFTFMAKELSWRVEKTLRKMGVRASDCIFTWVPRKRNAISRVGFDQGRELCRAVARELGGEVLPLFARFYGKEQKKLDRHGRARNAERSIVLNSSLSGFPRYFKEEKLEDVISGRSIVIIDDVMTSGATLKKGASLLMESGAGEIAVACVARAEGRAKKDKKVVEP